MSVSLFIIVFAIIATVGQIRLRVAAEDSHIFLYNTIDHCKKSEHFDVNYFKCKACDGALLLEAAADRKLNIKTVKQAVRQHYWS